jgi:hypothetical protein
MMACQSSRGTEQVHAQLFIRAAAAGVGFGGTGNHWQLLASCNTLVSGLMSPVAAETCCTGPSTWVEWLCIEQTAQLWHCVSAIGPSYEGYTLRTSCSSCCACFFEFGESRMPCIHLRKCIKRVRQVHSTSASGFRRLQRARAAAQKCCVSRTHYVASAPLIAFVRAWDRQPGPAEGAACHIA